MFIDKFLNFINQDDKDIFNFFTSLENRLFLTYYFEDIFDRNYIINFNDSNYFNKFKFSCPYFKQTIYNYLKFIT